MRRFVLRRDEDVSGLSGEGYVASGIEWDDGACAMRWNTEIKTTTFYTSVRDLLAIHGHGGRSTLEWLDVTSMSQEPRDFRSLDRDELDVILSLFRQIDDIAERYLSPSMQDLCEGLQDKLITWRRHAAGRPQDIRG